MNYAQAYVNLINRAKQRSASDLDPNQKYEWHHYFPVCFWRDKKVNTKTVALTLREHWVAHRLLFKMFPGKGTATALSCMSKRDPKMNSRKFETIRRVISEHNWTKTEEGRAFLSNQMQQRLENGWTHSEEVRRKLSETATRTQERWRKKGGHPLSSPNARQRSSQRAKERNGISNVCKNCGMVIGGGNGNMTQHQRGRKCQS